MKKIRCSQLGEISRLCPGASIPERQFKIQLKKFLSTAIYLLVLNTVLLLGTTTHAQPCPVETDLWGATQGRAAAPNIMQYLAVTDDDLTRVTKIRYCLSNRKNSGVYGNYMGFEVTIYSPTSGISTKAYGTMQSTLQKDFTCFVSSMGTEELMTLQLRRDTGDIEGMIWGGHRGSQWAQLANGQDAGPVYKMGGRPIGFRVWAGEGSSSMAGTDRQIILISVIYNSCNCPASEFIGDNPIQDMTINALVGQTQTQTLQYQKNYMEDIYGQDCGGYGMRYYPEYPFFSFSTSGNGKDARGDPYPDTATFTAGTMADVGQYPVTFVVFQDDNDLQHGFTTPYRGILPAVEQEFTLTINPCPVTNYRASVAMQDIIYRIPEASITKGTYTFEDQPNQCGYDQTTTVSGVPSWAVYDDTKRDFTVPQTSDIARVGAYPIAIASSIEVWDDYTKTTFKTHTTDSDFTIYIEPCLVDSLTPLNPIPNLEYTIGELQGVVSGAYEFVQSPDCGYDVDITITGLEPFFDHQQGLKNFSVQPTEDLSLAGTYTVQVQAQVTHITDHKQINTQTRTAVVSFDITMIDPCFDSVLDPLDIKDMARSVLQPGIIQHVHPSKDSVSEQYGSRDGFAYCGPRMIKVVGDPSAYNAFLGFDPFTNIMTVLTNDPNDVGVHNLFMRVYLENYPDVRAATPFTVTIDHCQVLDMQQMPSDEQHYTVYTPAIYFGTYFFTMTPACGYTLNYQIRVKDMATGVYTPLPLVIDNYSDLNFMVETNDPSYVGTYHISIIASVPSLYMTPAYEEEIFLILHINNDCQLDEVTALDTIPDQTYYIKADGLRDFNPTWSITIPFCPVTYEIGRIVNGVERPLTSVEYAVISHTTQDGQFSYYTEDFTLDTEVWTIRLYKRSTYSLSPSQDGVYLFDITFLDICWDAVLEPANFRVDEYLFDLWQQQNIFFTEALDTSNPTDFCGGYHSELEYFAGPLYDPTQQMGADLSFYGRVPVQGSSLIAFEGVMEDFDWLGTHYFRIKSTLGTPDPSPVARGNAGLYKTVYSDPVPVTLVNPCRNSTVNLDEEFFIQNLFVPINTERLWERQAGPTDFISDHYGNGYNRCGDRQYVFLNEDRRTTFHLDQFDYEVKHSTTGVAGELNMFLESFETGLEVTRNMTVRISLYDYPTATPYYQFVNLTYRECFPDPFEGSYIEDYTLQVGDDNFEVDADFSQWPCDYTQEFNMTVIDKETGQVVDTAGFIDQDGNVVIFDTPKGRDIGEYTVIVCSKIYNSVGSSACIDFDVVVEPEPTDIIYTTDPEFLLDLDNQRVKVGEALNYNIGLPVNNYGYRMELEFVMGDAFRFSSFDPEYNSFKVHEVLTTRDDIGVYPILVIARLFEADGEIWNFKEVYEKEFLLTVWDDPVPEPPAWFPPNPVYYDEWAAPIVRVDKRQPFDVRRPIPYIQTLTIEGVLVIGWDRTMTSPPNYLDIPPAKVAVEEDMNRHDERFWETRRKLRDYSDFIVAQEEAERVYFATKNKSYYELMQLIDALELCITPDDSTEETKKLEFTWDIIRFTEERIYIQLEFVEPWNISTNMAYDTLSVTFWGIQYFKSWQGVEVLYGTTLYYPLTRQIGPDAEYVGWLAELLKWPVILALLLILPVITAGSLLPTWVFLNSLQIISHTILLKTLMPANAHYFLKKWNDWIRWYDGDFWEHLQGMYDFKHYGVDFGHFHALLDLGDYTHLVAQNMIIVILVLLIFLTIWAAVIVKDFVVSFLPKQDKWWAKQHGPWCQNFILRYVYEFFLELCICVILQLSVKDLSEFSPSLQYFSSIGLFIAILSLVAFVFSLFYMGGPWISGFYIPETSLKSAGFDHRTRNPKFDGKQWLRDHPRPKIKPWGAFVITFDCTGVGRFFSCKGTKPGSQAPRVNFKKLNDVPDEPVQPKEKLATKGEDDDFNGIPQTERGLLSSLFARKDETQCDENHADAQENSGANINENEISPIQHYSLEMTAEQNGTQSDEEDPRNDKVKSNASRRSDNELDDTIKLDMQGEARNRDDGDEAQRYNQNDNADELYEGGAREMKKAAKKKKKKGSKSQSKSAAQSKTPKPAQKVTDATLNSAAAQQNKSNQSKKRTQEAQNKGKCGWYARMMAAVKRDNLAAKNPELSDKHRSEEAIAAMNKWAKREAHIRVKFADRMQTPQQYRTLFYGLKRNHERNVAIIHPLMFLLRRIIYALVIVFMDEVMYYGVFVVMLSCLAMLAFACTEWQWKEPIINHQHIFDECTIYVICLLLLCFSNFVTPEDRWFIGWILIGVCFVYVIFNTIVIIYYALCLMWVFLKRIFLQCRRRRLQKEAILIIDKLNRERLGRRPPVQEKKKPEPELEDSPLPVREEIPVIVEEPKPPKAEPVKEAPEEEEDSGDWFNADDIEQKKEEEPEGMWFVPVDTYAGGIAAQLLVDATLEAREQKALESVKKPIQAEVAIVEDTFDDPKDSSLASKDFFDPDEISNKSERYDVMFYKEWEEVEEIKVHDTKFISQQNFAEKKIGASESKKVEAQAALHVHTTSQSINGFQSAHGLIHPNDPVDISQLEADEHKLSLPLHKITDMVSSGNFAKGSLEHQRDDVQSHASQRSNKSALKSDNAAEKNPVVSRNDNMTHEELLLVNKLTRGLIQNGVVITGSTNQSNASDFTSRAHSRLHHKEKKDSSHESNKEVGIPAQTGSPDSQNHLYVSSQKQHIGGYDSYLKTMTQQDVSNAVKGLEGIGTMRIEASQTKPVTLSTKMYTQAIPRETFQNRRVKRAKEAGNTQGDKTMDRRESLKHIAALGSPKSDDSLDRASDETIKMSETVKLATKNAPGAEQKHPPLSARLGSAGKENSVNQSVKPGDASSSSVQVKSSTSANPGELKQYVSVDIDTWREMMNKANATLAAPARIVNAKQSPHQQAMRTNSQGSVERANGNTPYQGEKWTRLFNMDVGKNRLQSTQQLADDKTVQLNKQTAKPDNLFHTHGLATPKTTGVKPMSLTYMSSHRQQLPANKLFLDPRGNLVSEKEVISKEFGQLIMGNNVSRQNHDFHNGKTGDQGSCNNSILQMSDAFTYNGFGAATPGRNQSKNDLDGTPKETFFQHRGSADYYTMDPMAPEFIGCANKKSPISAKRGRSQLDRSTLSLRSSVEYDAPLPATALSILDSVPKMDGLAVRDPAKILNQSSFVRAHQNSVERATRKPRF